MWLLSYLLKNGFRLKIAIIAGTHRQNKDLHCHNFNFNKKIIEGEIVIYLLYVVFLSVISHICI
jgi:hypothetical protein